MAMLDENMAIRIRVTDELQTTTAATVHRAVYGTDRHSSVNLVYHKEHWRHKLAPTTMTKRIEQNCSGKSELKVTS